LHRQGWPRARSNVVSCDCFALGDRAIAPRQLVGDVFVDLGFDPMIAVADLDRLWKIARSNKAPDMRVRKLDALVGEGVVIEEFHSSSPHGPRLAVWGDK